jgi:glycosyltransferase involved in cell wall biosynthesis
MYSFWGYPMGLMVVVLGKTTFTPSVVNILGAETANVPGMRYGHLQKPLSRRLVLWTCRKANEVVAVANHQVDVLQAQGVTREFHVIPFGADSKLFYPMRKPLTPPLKILHVANLTPVKDQETLIKAFEIIRQEIPAVLRVVGPDHLDGQIQKSAAQSEFKNDIEFTGFVSYDCIPQHYQWADVFMLTSLSEGQNNSLMESMMCGLLPVSTAVGMMDMDFGNKVGITTACRDYSALGNAVVEHFKNRQLWQKKRDAALLWAQEHDLTWTIVQLKKVINDAC